MFKGVVFDCDGVLLDTERTQFDAWVITLKDFGVDYPIDEYYVYAGLPADKIVHLLNERHDYGLDEKTVVSQRKEILDDILAEIDFQLMPHARDILDFFKNLGYPIGLATGGMRSEVDLKLKATDIEKYFTKTVCGDEVKKGKPHSETYERVAAGIDTSPFDCIAFEDTSIGAQAAIDAGMTTYAVPTYLSEKQDFRKCEKTYKNLNEALNDFKQNKPF